MSIFSTIATTLQTATTIIPHVIELIKAVEIPEANGQGASKKDAVLGIVQAALVAIPDDVKAAIGGDKVVSLVSTIIDVVVKFLNAVGVFGKSTPTAAKPS